MAVSMAACRTATRNDSLATVVRNSVRSPSSARYPTATTAASMRAVCVPTGHFEAQHRSDRRDDEDERDEPGPHRVEVERLGGPVERDGVQHDEDDDQSRADHESEDSVTGGIELGRQRGLVLLGLLHRLVGR